MKLSFLLPAAVVATLSATSLVCAELPVVRVLVDDVRITESCEIEIPAGTVVPDANGPGRPDILMCKRVEAQP